MEPAACQIERLPEELLVHVISLTSPARACSAAAVSRAFRAAADSDVVWSCFLPHDLPQFDKKGLHRKPPSTRKGLFLGLANQPVLLLQKIICMQLDKATGAKCFTLCAKSLQFTPGFYWVNLCFDHSTRGKWFLKAAEFHYVERPLQIRGKIDRKMLSKNLTYAAYMVFKLAAYEFFGWDIMFEEASVTMGGRESTRRVCLVGYTEDGDGGSPNDQVPPRHVLLKSIWEKEPRVVSDLGEDVVVSRRRTDGWMEVELGEFQNEGDDADGEVFISLRDTGRNVKRYFTIRGIDIRPKHES